MPINQPCAESTKVLKYSGFTIQASSMIGMANAKRPNRYCINFDKKWKNKLPKKLKFPTAGSSKNKNEIGVYEGAGYTSKGVYRAFQECKMKSNSTNEFCEVCEETVVKVLKYYRE